MDVKEQKTTITNTKIDDKISLHLEKVWNDTKDHTEDNVTIKVVRAIRPDVVSLNPILTLSTNSVAVSNSGNSSATVNANKEMSVKEYNSDLVSVNPSGDGKSITITGNNTTNESTVTTVVKVTDGTDVEKITVVISPRLSLTPNSVTLLAGGNTAEISVNRENIVITPAENNPDCCTISSTSSGGTTKITVTSAETTAGDATFTVSDGEETKTFQVHVVQISATPASVVEGGIVTLTPESGVEYSYSSSDAGVSGSITGNTFIPPKAGNYTITGKMGTGSLLNTGTTQVTVTAFAISGADESHDVPIGGTLQLSCNVPDNRTVTWLSSDTADKITVDSSGLVTANSNLNGGKTATITATFSDGTNLHTATYTVTAKDDSNKFKLSPSSVVMKVGDTVTLTCLYYSSIMI